MLNEKICLVTGAARGIGKAIVQKFVQEGAVVYANARMTGSMDHWAEEVSRTAPGFVFPAYFDITDPSAVKQAIMRIKKEHGRVDVLVNNAGVGLNERLGMISMDKTRSMFEVNVFALLELSQFVATRFMMKQRSGSIINIASVVGIKGSEGQIAYSASKGAVIAMTRSMAKELAAYNIRVNAVAPGITDTGMLGDAKPEQLEKRIKLILLGRIADPKDIANAVSFLASDQAGYITGQILGVDGGAIM